MELGCLRYCKSTIFQANHNPIPLPPLVWRVVCDTAKVRFFKQITTIINLFRVKRQLFAILQKYDFSSKSQHNDESGEHCSVVCDTAKVRFFKQITTPKIKARCFLVLFAILQKYDFSSKSQPDDELVNLLPSCLRYCKSTIFQANHNLLLILILLLWLFAILQKYDFSSKSQHHNK